MTENIVIKDLLNNTFSEPSYTINEEDIYIYICVCVDLLYHYSD